MSSVEEQVRTYISKQDLSVVVAKLLLVIISIISIYLFYEYRGNIMIMILCVGVAIVCVILLIMDPTSVRFWLWKIGIEAEDPRQEDDVVGQMQELADDDNIRDSAEEVEWDTDGNRRVKFKD